MTAPAKAAAAPAAPAGRSHSLVWLQGLLCGALAAVDAPLAVLCLALLAPAGAALLLDRVPGRPAARAVLLFGIAGSLPVFRRFWSGARGMDAALSLALDPAVLGTAWVAAACGWLLAELTPLAVRLVLDARSRRQAAALRAQRRAYEEEWGLPPACGENPAADANLADS